MRSRWGPGSALALLACPGRRVVVETGEYFCRPPFSHGMIGTIRKLQGIRMRKFCLAILFGTVIATPSYAARCGGDFNSFVAAMSGEAQAAGVSPAVISQALSGVTQDPAVLNFDRRQRGTFKKTFEQYVSTRVGPGRINMGRQMLQRHAALLARIEQQFGVPPQIVV
ncbi:MAG TPA: lytic murein transglycosylase, partial [Micropepsaceae bacterium]|nr:lytic murein transglycosylase [Micropepsaceae bacterium]